MTGGKSKNNSSPLTLKKELRDIQSKIEKQNKIVSDLELNISSLQSKREHLSSEIVQIQIDLATLSTVVDSKKSKMDSLKVQYEELNPKKEELSISHEDTLISALSNAYKRRDDIISSINLKRERRYKAGSEAERIDVKIRTIRRESNILSNQEKDIQINQARSEANLENALNRLSSNYEMTYEFAKKHKVEQNLEEAKERVKELRNEISALGNIKS